MNRNIKSTLIKLESTMLAAACLLPSLVLCSCKRETETSEPTPSAVIDITPSPTPDPRPGILDKASAVGLSKEDLREKYDLFLEYADVVEANTNLNGYGNYVYRLFPVLADHMKNTNKTFFFEKVKTLTITDGDPADGVCGYDLESNTVTIAYKDREALGEGYLDFFMYHELIRFVDNWIDGEPTHLYRKTDGTIAEATGDPDEAVFNPVYFTEGGYELYCAKYFTGAPAFGEYSVGAAFLTGCEYILGEDAVAEIFFSHDTENRFAQLMKENGFSSEEICKFFEAQQLVDDNFKFSANTTMDPREVLIRLYVKKSNFYYQKDDAFLKILSCMDNKRLNQTMSRYRSFLSGCAGLSDKQKNELLDTCKQTTDGIDADISMYTAPSVLIVDGKVKLTTILTYKTETSCKYLIVVFDYDLNDKTIIECAIYAQGEGVLGSQTYDASSELSEETKQKFADLTSDNSAAHDAEVTGNNTTLSSAYKKASSLQKRYGIYIWFDDLIPDGLLLADDTRAVDYEEISGALIQIESVLSLYPDDFFDQLLFDGYEGVGICMYSGWYEYAYKNHVTVNGKSFFVFYVDVSVGCQEGNGHTGESEVCKQIFKNVNPIASELICDIWSLIEEFNNNRNKYLKHSSTTDSAWKKLNPDKFNYTDSEDENELKSYAADTDMKFFLANGALSSAENDRCLIYLYVMLSALNGSQPSTLTPECLAKAKEINRAVRCIFNTEKWPAETSWEKVIK